MADHAYPGQVDKRPGATAFKLEFWCDATGQPRKHRSRYYPTLKGMQAAGHRWEAKSSEHWCRYWNGLYTWVSEHRRQRT